MSGGCVAGLMQKVCPSASDRRLKDTVVRLGQHKQGFGLYLFNYRPEFQSFGSGRQFGVMADEVAAVRPDAVFIGPDGYQRVDYAALGIARVLN